ncbi:hypothetical protein [Nonomuraea insulae]|uniref:Uncharacterized protein n=1 Tax=Nonomuraea insulae TaxID=1616787 RepID=A0ABW1CV13_9ACTN
MTYDEATEDFRAYMERSLLAGVERYVNRVFISGAELDDLTGSNPTGLSPFLRDIQRDSIVHEAARIIADHRHALLTRSRREIPPALHPHARPLHLVKESAWPRPTH